MGDPGYFCNLHSASSVRKKRSQQQAKESFLIPEGFSAIRGQMRGACFSMLADTEQGAWDPEESWQVKEVNGEKCLMFLREAGRKLTRGLASVLLRGQMRCSSLARAFIGSRIRQGLNPWCREEGIFLPLLMAAMSAMWPNASADKLCEFLGQEYLCAGANPTDYLRRDTPLVLREPLTGLTLLRWGFDVHTRTEAVQNMKKKTTPSASNAVLC